MQSSVETRTMEPTGQARAPETQPFGGTAFGESDSTTLRWLGMAGFLINSRGTTIMIDPLLEGFDMPIMIDMPIAAEDVPGVDAILVTHSDNDHFSVPSTLPTSPRSTATRRRCPAWSRTLSASSSSLRASRTPSAA